MTEIQITKVLGYLHESNEDKEIQFNDLYDNHRNISMSLERELTRTENMQQKK